MARRSLTRLRSKLIALAWELGVPASELPWRDHDHSTEDAVLHAFEDPTPEN